MEPILSEKESTHLKDSLSRSQQDDVQTEGTELIQQFTVQTQTTVDGKNSPTRLRMYKPIDKETPTRVVSCLEESRPLQLQSLEKTRNLASPSTPQLYECYNGCQSHYKGCGCGVYFADGKRAPQRMQPIGMDWSTSQNESPIKLQPVVVEHMI